MKAFIFPGQGSQAIGMGADLAQRFHTAAAVFEEVDEALSESLSKTMWAGQADVLTLTRNAQPALMAVSVAIVRVLEQEGFHLAEQGKFVAGHSLGEYSALVALGALSLGDGARLLRLRGEAMQQAMPLGEGVMVALLGLEYEDVVAVVKALSPESGVCAIANDNATGQVVISGTKKAVAEATELAKARGVKKAIMLDVSVCFHCPLMQPAADKMREALAEIEIKPPQLPLVENVIAKATSDPETIRKLLVEQITACVRWRETIRFMCDQGIKTFYELGAGKVLTGMVKRIDRQASARPVGTVEEIDNLLQILQQEAS